MYFLATVYYLTFKWHFSVTDILIAVFVQTMSTIRVIQTFRTNCLKNTYRLRLQPDNLKGKYIIQSATDRSVHRLLGGLLIDPLPYGDTFHPWVCLLKVSFDVSLLP